MDELSRIMKIQNGNTKKKEALNYEGTNSYWVLTMNERGKEGEWDENEALSVYAKRAHLVCWTACLWDPY